MNSPGREKQSGGPYIEHLGLAVPASVPIALVVGPNPFEQGGHDQSVVPFVDALASPATSVFSENGADRARNLRCIDTPAIAS